ncbi:nuclear transport factor 2 family protein [Kitasatospora sp. NBC_01287]|uniref:nuclear transport factor 2 family protein n=1 Tax=Kitasatospora sp. NBC_01287 TaxID=2903573 RepID=UPI002255C038|nr:nuclear transport factor 2 family protein [Kitasatospora sp. NBC_01287]MCX4745385.1 nuclear transport factor 2 family protein [Kitasatospora sp. NBC_01287]
MSTRDDVIETTVRMCWYTDLRAWDRLGEVMAEKVALDYSSFGVGAPTEVGRGDLIASWRSLLGGLKATQHILTNHLVTRDGDQAICTAHFQATHIADIGLGENTYTLGGRYKFGLRLTEQTWLIESIVMTAIWAKGNREIFSVAQAAQAEQADHH